MMFFLVVINLLILYVNAEVTTDMGPINLSASIKRVYPLYKPLQPGDVLATKNGIEHVEWLRSKFTNGHGYMPPLDPFKKSSLEPIHIQEGIVDGYIVLTNLRVDGIKKFHMNLMEIRMSINTVNADITIPQIVSNVDFDAEVVLGILPLTISGHLESILTGVKVVGEFSSTETPMGGMEVFQVTADKLQVTADNMRLKLSDLSIDTYEQVVRKWWGNLKDDMAKLINNAVVQQINDIVKHYSTKQVRDFLLTP